MRQSLQGFRKQLLLLACWCLPILAAGQGWQRFVGATGDQRAFAIRLTSDGGLIAAGSTSDSVGGATNWYIMRADSLGNLILQQQWGAVDTSESAVSLWPLDSHTLVAGNAGYAFADTTGPVQRSVILWNTIDGQGNNLSGGKDGQANAIVNQVSSFHQGHLLVGANYFSFSDNYFPEPYVIFLDSMGTFAWSKTYPITQYGEAVNALALDNLEAVIAVKEYTASDHADITCYKINPAGDLLLRKQLELSTDDRPKVLLQSGSGNLILVGDQTDFTTAPDLFVVKIDPVTLDTLWMHRIVLPGTQSAHAAVLLDNGHLAIVGENIPEGSTSRDAFLALTDSLGNLLWFNTYGGLKGDIFWDIQAVTDGNGFLIAGQTASFSQSGDLQAWLVRTDSLGAVWSNRLVGRVVRDSIQNCLVDPLETPLSEWLITASGPNGLLYTQTDALGNYSIAIDTGTWFVSSLPPAGYWLPCEDSIQVDFSTITDTVSVDFPTQVLFECPLLDVDLTTPFLRRCFENTYYVRYFNYGTQTAPDALISVVLDPYLSITGSNMPYSQSGDTLLFSVGTVPWLTGGNFEFTAFLDCDSTILGQIHCSEAHIYPDSLCYTFDPDWDGSHLEVDGYCAGDSVVLTVTNTGAGMEGPVSFIIMEDQIIFRLSILQLGEGQDSTFVLFPNGATVTMVVTQVPGHPGDHQPMLVVEGCGAGTYSTGYAFQFPQNDGDPATDIECRLNIGSFDPNDKTGLPLGVTDQGVIAPETRLEYLIRFQNTGTDTAFRVEIRDTLSPALDLATFREGAASHPYRLKINSPGVLSFLFDPIELPDSSSSQTASQGFIKFSIHPKAGIPLGTVIENTAAIYFDFNPAIRTNTTRHTIENPMDFLNTKTLEPIGHNATKGQLMVVPNPTNGQILVNLRQPSYSGGLYVDINNALGIKQLDTKYWQDPNRGPFEADVSCLPAGIYFITAKNERGSTVARERIVKI